jgi:hypothetical protein
MNGLEVTSTIAAVVQGHQRFEVAVKVVPNGDGIAHQSSARGTSVELSYCYGGMADSCFSWHVLYQSTSVSVNGRDADSSLISVGVGYAL